MVLTRLADKGPRGQRVSSFMQSHTWLSGPDFLIKSEAEWPKNPENLDLPAADPEIKGNAKVNNALLVDEHTDSVQKL